MVQTFEDWKVRQELDPTIRWTPRWKAEPEQMLRFLSEPVVLQVHAGRMFTLVCQKEFLSGLADKQDARFRAHYGCRLCLDGKPPRQVGLGVVEKDGDGLPRLLTAGVEKFWAPFLREHQGSLPHSAFRISYDHESRKYGWKLLPEEGDSGSFVGPDYLDTATRMLARDELYDKYSIAFPMPDGMRDRRRDAFVPNTAEDSEVEVTSGFAFLDDPDL